MGTERTVHMSAEPVTLDSAPVVNDGVLAMTAGGVDGLLEPTSLEVRPGQVVVAVGPIGRSHAAIALVLAGRLDLTSGFVSLDGDVDDRHRRPAVALVDVPGINDPDDATPFRALVGEELALAGQPSGRTAIAGWLADHDLAADRRPTGQVPADIRLRLLVDLAAVRPGVRYLVVVSPDRHGLTPTQWWPIVRDAAEAGLGVVVTVSDPVDLTAVTAERVDLGAAPHISQPQHGAEDEQ